MKSINPNFSVALLAHLIFGFTAILFFRTFYLPDPNNPYHFYRFLGVAFTMYSSLWGAYFFATTQSNVAVPWVRGLNLITLSSSVFLCLLAMVPPFSTQGYNIVTLTAIFLYVVWDLFALKYFRKCSPQWTNYYGFLLWFDFGFFLLCTVVSYLPELTSILGKHALQNGAIDLSEKDALIISDFTTGATLIVQVLFFLFFAEYIKKVLMKSNYIQPVQEGYALWAPLYDQGNAVTDVEGRHTSKRITELDCENKHLLDLGCGTGLKSLALAGRGASVTAIDRSGEMLDQFRARLDQAQASKISILQRPVTNFFEVGDNSIDGVICCLVIDHLEDYDLATTIHEINRVLKSGGWLYITDVNPYFEMLEEKYAKFLDKDGVEQRIRVYPHTVQEVTSNLVAGGFASPVIQEACVDEQVMSQRNMPNNLSNFPLIVEYFSRKM